MYSCLSPSTLWGPVICYKIIVQGYRATLPVMNLVALRPAGSDPRVGDGLVWNPLPMAFKYTFLDRMQRS